MISETIVESSAFCATHTYIYVYTSYVCFAMDATMVQRNWFSKVCNLLKSCIFCLVYQVTSSLLGYISGCSPHRYQCA